MKQGKRIMTLQEQRFFLNIISDHLRGRKTEWNGQIDPGLLLQTAKEQQVSFIIYCQTNIAELKSAFVSSSYYYTNRKRILEKIDAVFHEKNIPYILFKGTEIAQYYPVPSARTMGDSDLLVHSEDKERAHEALLSIGLVNQKQCDMEWVYEKNGIQFELHHRLLYDELVNEAQMKAWTDTVWEHAATSDGIRYTLELEYHLVYLIIHLRKHFLHSGVGFRMFMDLAVVAEQETDWEKVQNYLEEVQLLPFAQTCYALIERWFSVSTPITGTITDEFYEAATAQIFANGVFGFDDEANTDNLISNSVRQYGKLGHMVHCVFPSYKDMSDAKSYAFLKDRPYLLPFAWGYRWYYVVAHKKAGAGMADAVKPYTKQGQFSKRDSVLKQWGL